MKKQIISLIIFNVDLILPVPNTLNVEWKINGNELNNILNLENTIFSIQLKPS